MQLTARTLEYFEKHPIKFLFIFAIYTLFIGGAGWIVPFLTQNRVECNPNLQCPIRVQAQKIPIK